ERLSENSHFYITDTSGLTVAEINKFREMCFKEGVEYRVFKNTLIKKALDQSETDFTALYPSLKGFSGVMFAKENANAPAKLILKYQKGDAADRPQFKAASIDTDIFIGADQLKALGSLKSKQELIGEVIGLLQSPAKNVISALQSGGDKLAGIVKTLSEKES
ncbi:MAG: large subunit ribosomal protein L10, partial [Cyclobacteriaceae bacterium]